MFDKLVIALVSPLGTALMLGGFGLGLGLAKRSRPAWICALLGFVWLTTWSLPIVSHALRGAVERDYAAVQPAALPEAEAIVVLGGGVRPAGARGEPPDLAGAADRVWFGARLFHAGRAPLLVLSGGSNPQISATSEAEAMRAFAIDLGVPAGALVLEAGSRNTRENARLTAQLLRPESRILLVTSALHMRRAMALFEGQGLLVTPAPTDHEARTRFTATDWLPDAEALDGSGRAIKELIGRLAGR